MFLLLMVHSVRRDELEQEFLQVAFINPCWFNITALSVVSLWILMPRTPAISSLTKGQSLHASTPEQSLQFILC